VLILTEAVRPKPGQRRERKQVGQALYLRCYGSFHDGEWLSSDRFGKNSKGYFSTLCRECRQYYYVKKRGGNGEVKLTTVRKWLEEVVARCGTISGAARTMGVSQPTIFRWLGRYKGYEQQRINRKSVKLILETLGGLRNGTITPSPTKINHGRKFKYGCTGCGCKLEQYTPGCKICRNRRQRKAWSNKQDREIIRATWREQGRKRLQRQREEEQRLTTAA
jgi:hypothetical protein